MPAQFPVLAVGERLSLNLALSEGRLVAGLSDASQPSKLHIPVHIGSERGGLTVRIPTLAPSIDFQPHIFAELWENVLGTFLDAQVHNRTAVTLSLGHFLAALEPEFPSPTRSELLQAIAAMDYNSALTTIDDFLRGKEKRIANLAKITRLEKLPIRYQDLSLLCHWQELACCDTADKAFKLVSPTMNARYHRHGRLKNITFRRYLVGRGLHFCNPGWHQ